jgi:hypothetical protein
METEGSLPYLQEPSTGPYPEPDLHSSFLIIDSLDGGSARRKAATYTWQHKHKINKNIHAFSGIRMHDPSVRADEDISCLRRRRYRLNSMKLIAYFFLMGKRKFLQSER